MVRSFNHKYELPIVSADNPGFRPIPTVAPSAANDIQELEIDKETFRNKKKQDSKQLFFANLFQQDQVSQSFGMPSIATIAPPTPLTYTYTYATAGTSIIVDSFIYLKSFNAPHLLHTMSYLRLLFKKWNE